MAKKFSELRAKMSPEAQARAAARAEAMLVEMQLQELRKARKVTQVEVAKAKHGAPTTRLCGAKVKSLVAYRANDLKLRAEGGSATAGQAHRRGA